MPFIGPLFLQTLVYPVGIVLIDGISRSVFAPQAVPEDYVRHAAIRLVLRPKTFIANARDLVLLKNFIATQVPRYVDLRAPTIIMTGDCDAIVPPEINAYAFAATLPRAKLVVLKGVGHMPHHAAPEAVAAAIDELGRRHFYYRARQRRTSKSRIGRAMSVHLSRGDIHQRDRHVG